MLLVWDRVWIWYELFGSPACIAGLVEAMGFRSSPFRQLMAGFSPAATSLYTVSSEGKNSLEGKKKVEVIDLTLESSSDEEEPPAKKQCPVSGVALPTAAGPKG